MSRTLLIIEDEVELCELIALQLDIPDVRVLECHSSLEAYNILQNEDVDLVITDLTMPKMNGLELIEKCKNELKQQPTFFLITGYVGYDESDLKNKGVHKLFQKPDDISRLIDESTQFFAKT